MRATPRVSAIASASENVRGKTARARALKERRAHKQEKKDEKKQAVAARSANAVDSTLSAHMVEGETSSGRAIARASPQRSYAATAGGSAKASTPVAESAAYLPRVQEDAVANDEPPVRPLLREHIARKRELDDVKAQAVRLENELTIVDDEVRRIRCRTAVSMSRESVAQARARNA